MSETILFAFLLAKIKGNKLMPAIKCAWLWPIFLFDIYTIWLQAQVFMQNTSYIPFGIYYKTIYMVLFVIPLLRYKLYWPGIVGSGFIILGTLSNNLVKSVNGGKMPVYPTFSYITTYFEKGIHGNFEKSHVMLTAASHLKILSDYIDLGYSIISIGDILIRVFVVIMIYYTIKAVQTPQGDLKLRSETCV